MRSDRPPTRFQTIEKPPPEVGAAEHLRYIRTVMERSGSFTALPGWGAVVIGATAILAAVAASFAPSQTVWLAVWLAEALIAVSIAGLTLVRKAKAVGVPVHSGPARKYFLSLAPPVLVGALLTIVLWRVDEAALLPGIWLLLYGTGTVTGGAFSVRIVPMMGLSFMALGTVALLVPGLWPDLFLGLGFGGLHVVFGWIIAKHYGG